MRLIWLYIYPQNRQSLITYNLLKMLKNFNSTDDIVQTGLRNNTPI